MSVGAWSNGRIYPNNSRDVWLKINQGILPRCLFFLFIFKGGLVAPSSNHVLKTRRSMAAAQFPEVVSSTQSFGEISWASESKMDKLMKELRRQRACAKAKVSSFLTDHGFPMNVNSQKRRLFGMSYTYPLHVAVMENNVEIVMLLLDCGADPAARDSRGRTPLQRAASFEVQQSFATRARRRKVLSHL
ncbi:unnamed protein product [Effrenium voratum]|nr:unnamed protein product [Effrenium voratum]CAJ1429014.1 unnamed protein product [Effrenium voratum]